ncbi:E3 ubiquitin-protein ligase RNF123, partial [Engystomops pustulosus]|uniref:E3 ubiquitin-protein ligase RNF123 n=1 Tax=Engystomops pustulosus TaxID=76066 RepID=UPI003AFAD632
MASRGSGMSLTRRNYRLSSDPEKSRAAGIVSDRFLSQYLHRIFPGSDGTQHGATYRKPLTFQNLEERLNRLLSAAETEENT